MIRIKWEYKIIKLYPVGTDAEHQLNVLGEEGWEVCSVNFNMAYLKRYEAK